MIEVLNPVSSPSVPATAIGNEPTQQLAHAEQLEQAGQLGQAEAIYRRLLKAYPTEPILLYDLGHLLWRRGTLAEAESLLRQAIDSAPQEPAFHNTLGAVLHDGRNLAAAETAYRRALELRPEYAEAHYNLGLVLEDAGRFQEAARAYQTAAALQPGYARALARLGAVLNQFERLDDALKILDQALAADPQLFDARYYRGWVLSKLRRHDEAIDELRRAGRLRPDSFESALAFANALRDAGRHDDALYAYGELIKARPERAATHVELNQLAWLAGRKDLYLQSFAYARERLGERPELLQLEAAFHLRRDGYLRAEELLGKAQQLDPENGAIAGLRARALAGQGRFEESFACFQQAVAAAPAELIHRHEFGFALLRAGQTAEALKVFEQARALNPVDQLTLAGLSLAYRELADSRYHKLVDFSRYVRVYDLEVPDGFADARSFNLVLAEELDRLHTMKAEPIDQTLRGGTQTVGRLFDEKSAAIARVRAGIEEAVLDYIDSLPKDPLHPMSLRRLDDFAFSGSWSCRLGSGGYHNNHVHPQGWISSAYYARLPEDLANDPSRSGWLKFGESNLGLGGGNDRAEHAVQPAVGRLVLFPSFYWHGTIPFDNRGDRLAVAFDVIPVQSD